MRKTMTMLLLLVAAFSMLGLVFAQQSFTLDPTTGGGGVFRIGHTHASVNQRVKIHIPVAYGLAIDDAATLTFDLSQLSTDTNQIVCVTGIATDGVIQDVPQANGGVHPLGTYYMTGNTFGTGSVQVQGGQQVTQYPPVAINPKTGGVDVGSKGDFICYRSFILEKFANTPGWDVTVTRTDVGQNATNNNTPMYVQDNICADFGANTGLFQLDNGATQDLFQGGLLSSYQNETTGAAVDAANTANQGACGNPTSWLNDLVVVGIRVDGNNAGTYRTNLKYTIQALPIE